MKNEYVKAMTRKIVSAYGFEHSRTIHFFRAIEKYEKGKITIDHLEYIYKNMMRKARTI